MRVLDSNTVMQEAAKLRAAGKQEECLQICCTAIEQFPKLPNFKFAAASAFIDMGLIGYAILCLESALKDDPNNFRISMNLASCYRRTYRLDKAISFSKRSLKHLKQENPDWEDREDLKETFGVLYSNLSACYVNEGTARKGVGFARLAVEYGGSAIAIAKWNLSLILLELGRWEEGFQMYCEGKGTNKRKPLNYAEIMRNDMPTGNEKTPILENLDDMKPGQLVVVYGEQGIGDEIMFGTCLTEFLEDCKKRRARVIFECQGKLEELFKNAFPEIEIKGTRNENVIHWPLEEPIDWAIPIGDLPAFYRKHDSDFIRATKKGYSNYLRVDAQEVERLRAKAEKKDGRPVIGIAWSGGIIKTATQYRSIPLEHLAPILEIDANFVSLQYEDPGREINRLERKYQGRLSEIQQFNYLTGIETESYQGVANLVCACDIVVTVCQSVAHLCGALNIPCIVLVPYKCAWRYCPNRGRVDSQIWYKNNTLIRMRENDHWMTVIRECRKMLEDRLW